MNTLLSKVTAQYLAHISRLKTKQDKCRDKLHANSRKLSDISQVIFDKQEELRELQRQAKHLVNGIDWARNRWDVLEEEISEAENRIPETCPFERTY